MENARFGIIGAGLMGGIHARNIARRLRYASVLAVADIDREAGERCARECGATVVCGDYRELLSPSDIDAVAVCTPPESHAEIIAAAAVAGKHVFCEKPLACDLESADQALSAVAKAGVKLQVGFNRRFDRNFLHAYYAIRNGDVGEVLSMHLVSRDPVRLPDETPQFEPEMFLDTTIHDLDMVRFLTGREVRTVLATGQPGPDVARSPQSAVVLLTLEGGGSATIDNSWLSDYGYDQRVEVFGDKGGAIRMENEPVNTATHYTSGGGVSSPPMRFFAQRYADAYITEMSAFVSNVISDSEPPVSGDDGRKALALALACRRSWKVGRPVAASEID